MTHRLKYALQDHFHATWSSESDIYEFAWEQGRLFVQEYPEYRRAKTLIQSEFIRLGRINH